VKPTSTVLPFTVIRLDNKKEYVTEELARIWQALFIGQDDGRI
jgi:hypothetical protein